MGEIKTADLAEHWLTGTPGPSLWHLQVAWKRLLPSMLTDGGGGGWGGGGIYNDSVASGCVMYSEKRK